MEMEALVFDIQKKKIRLGHDEDMKIEYSKLFL